MTDTDQLVIIDPILDDASTKHVECLCYDCVFNVKDGSGSQIDCRLGKIDEFKQSKAQVVFNTDHMCYSINRYCKWFRNEEWAEKQDNDIVGVVEKETAIRWSAILELSDIHKLDICLTKIMDQETPPQALCIVTKLNPIDVVKVCQKALTIPWVVEIPHEDESFDRCIQRLVRSKSPRLNRSQFYVWFNGNIHIYQDIIKHISRLVNHKMMQLLVVFPKDTNHGLVVNRLALGMFYTQSKETTILEQLKNMFGFKDDQEEYHSEHITTWKKILSNQI